MHFSISKIVINAHVYWAERVVDQTLYKTIREAIPEAEECISWNMPTFKKVKNIIHFAPAKKHLGIYAGPEAIEAYAHKLKDYNTSKGAIQFPYNKDVPYQLIAEIARWSYEHNAQ